MQATTKRITALSSSRSSTLLGGIGGGSVKTSSKRAAPVEEFDDDDPFGCSSSDSLHAASASPPTPPAARVAPRSGTLDKLLSASLSSSKPPPPKRMKATGTASFPRPASVAAMLSPAPSAAIAAFSSSPKPASKRSPLAAASSPAAISSLSPSASPSPAAAAASSSPSSPELHQLQMGDLFDRSRRRTPEEAKAFLKAQQDGSDQQCVRCQTFLGDDVTMQQHNENCPLHPPPLSAPGLLAGAAGAACQQDMSFPPLPGSKLFRFDRSLFSQLPSSSPCLRDVKRTLLWLGDVLSNQNGWDLHRAVKSGDVDTMESEEFDKLKESDEQEVSVSAAAALAFLTCTIACALFSHTLVSLLCFFFFLLPSCGFSCALNPSWCASC